MSKQPKFKSPVRRRSLLFEPLESRLPLASSVVISEFMASNANTLLDEDGDSSDWLEVHNPTEDAVSLGGWYLTDDAEILDKWQFPDVTLAAGDYLLVFASDKDRAISSSELHANFKLSASGEYVGLVESDGVAIAHEYAPEFPSQFQDISYGLAMQGTTQVLLTSGASSQVHVPTDNGLGLTWTTLGFDDTGWQTGFTGVGYENTPPGYQPLLGNLVPSGTTSAYIRVPFQVTDASAVSSLTLKMKFDDGYAAYLNGVRLDILATNAPDPLLWNSTASDDRNDVAAVEFRDYDISGQRGLLQDGANVLAIHGLNWSSGSSDMLIVPELLAGEFTLIEPLAAGYFAAASPGSANTASFQGFVADTTFNVDRGFYDAPFQLTFTSATPGATIAYTLDGTVPTLTNGTLVPAADANTPPLAELQVDGGADGVVTLRAAAFKDGFAPTNVDTQTYVFPDEVIARQTEAAGTPANFPANGAVNGHDMDYGFAADILNHSTWGPQLESSLESLPALSLVTEPDHLFGASTGIYVNQGQSGRAWERPASLELINSDGSDGFQVETGVRIRGNFSLSDGNPKHAFRLFFRDEYGDSKLRFPLFGSEGADEFDKFDLRTFQNDSWAWQNSDELTMIHDVFSRDTQRDMGQPYTRSRYYHLYINGQYWGIYQTQERSDAAFGESYFGGAREEYDTIKAAGGSQGYVTEATDGNMNGAWRELWDLVNLIENESDPTENYRLYMQAQGLNLDGSRNPAFPVLLDADNLIDYMNVIFYTNDEDAPLSRPLSNNRSNNWFGVRNRNGEDGFRFFAHDAEQTMISKHNVGGLTGDRTGPFNNSNKDNFAYSNPQWMHEDLMEGSAEYRLRFADRVQSHYFHGGALSEAAVTARFDARAAELDAAVVAQSARWGNGSGQNPSSDKNTWLNALEGMRNAYFQASPQTRGQIVLDQLREDDLYPDIGAVAFNQHGGSIPSGFALTLSVPPVGSDSSGDFDGDGDTDVDDFAILTDPANWLQNVPAGTRGDMDGDGFVNLTDFGLFKQALDLEMPPIYYTLDGVTDPRAVGGALNPSPTVMLYADTPITLNATTTVRTRAWDGTTWSALTEATFVVDPVARSFAGLKGESARERTALAEPDPFAQRTSLVNRVRDRDIYVPEGNYAESTVRQTDIVFAVSTQPRSSAFKNTSARRHHDREADADELAESMWDRAFAELGGKSLLGQSHGDDSR